MGPIFWSLQEFGGVSLMESLGDYFLISKWFIFYPKRYHDYPYGSPPISKKNSFVLILSAMEI
jgi:hypothetical protein